MATYFTAANLDPYHKGIFDTVEPDAFNKHDLVSEELDQELRIRFEDWDLASIDVTPLKTAAIYLNLQMVCAENAHSPDDMWMLQQRFYERKYERAMERGILEIEDSLQSDGGEFVR